MTMTSIKLKVTPEETQPISDPVSYATISGDFLSPHSGGQRNSLTSTGECSYRRRRPITLRIMPRLSLPGRSTSAPASVTEPDWSLARYVKSLEEAFTIVFLVQVTANVIPIFMIGFNFMLVPVMSLQFARSIFFFLAVILELTLFCVPGNELTIQSIKVRDACYALKWNECSPLVRKTLLMIMERTKRPFAITAGKFVTLSLQSLVSILKSSLSYLMVLQQLYSKSGIK